MTKLTPDAQKLIKTSVIDRNYIIQVLGRKLIDRARITKSDLLNDLERIPFVDRTARQNLTRGEDEQVDRLSNQVAEACTAAMARKNTAEIVDACQLFLRLEALVTTMLIKHELRDTIWRLGFAMLKGLEVESKDKLLAIDRALACTDFSGPTNTPYSCIEATPVLHCVQSAKSELEKLRRRVLARESQYSETMDPSLRPPPASAFFRFVVERGALIRAGMPLVEGLAVKKYGDGHTLATRGQSDYFQKLLYDLEAVFKELREDVRKEVWTEPLTLGHGAILVAQIECGRQRFPELFYNQEETATNHNKHATESPPTCNTEGGILRRLSRRRASSRACESSRAGTQSESDSCHAMSLGSSSSDHRQRLARLARSHAHV